MAKNPESSKQSINIPNNAFQNNACKYKKSAYLEKN